MIDRLSSGSDRLDAVLGGGLQRNGIVLIGGNPGSGKTILAQQYVFHNATPDRPALYLSTVSEPLEKILRYEEAGVDLLLCLVNPYEIAHEKVMQTIELMGKHVLPEFT